MADESTETGTPETTAADAAADGTPATKGKGKGARKERLATLDQKAVRKVARALARVETADEEGKTPETRKAHWTDNKKEYMAKARKLVRRLHVEGVNLVVDPSAPGATDDSETGSADEPATEA